MVTKMSSSVSVFVWASEGVPMTASYLDVCVMLAL